MNAEPVRLKADVVVVGAGPVGLTLAMDLAWRGVEVIVIEARPRGQPPSVKSNHVSARSMEIFRRLGVAGKVRNAGLPADYPNDVAYRTSFLGRESRVSPFPVAPIVTPRRSAPMPIGRRPNRHTGSTRSIWNRFCSSISKRCRQLAFCRRLPTRT